MQTSVSTKGIPSRQPCLGAQQMGCYGIFHGQIRDQQTRLNRVLDQGSRAGCGGSRAILSVEIFRSIGLGQRRIPMKAEHWKDPGVMERKRGERPGSKGEGRTGVVSETRI
jgi:hypothetical protein